ncbi:ornithine cyclodeaminase [Pseudochrobactrum sp. MP213Fo]|uniref:ornithine cyclodeaminase n=1 Tax=Pseudochrobactrum sp. MP213Fo TaxID=3022250 RepID=UPI003BA0D02F
MKYFDAKTVEKLLNYDELIEALAQSHQGNMPESAHMLRNEPEEGHNQFIALVGWQKDEIIAVKLVGVFPDNLKMQPAQPSIQGVVVAFDAKTGAPKFSADGAEMTFRKTAGVSGLGSRILARQDAETLLVVGAGGLAPHVLQAHCAARPSIKKVLIWNRTFSKAEALAAVWNTVERPVQAVSDLSAATQVADIISCVTMSDTPLIKGEDLKAGAHLDLVGAYMPTMREADNAAMLKGRIYVDTRQNMEGAGDLRQPVDLGLMGWDCIQGDLFDLNKKSVPARLSADEITIFKNVGGGHLDLFTAQMLGRHI